MLLLEKLKEERLGRERFGIKRKKKEVVIIANSLIENEEKNLYQYCNKCETERCHSRITYDGGKRAIRCSLCSKITKLKIPN